MPLGKKHTILSFTINKSLKAALKFQHRREMGKDGCSALPAPLRSLNLGTINKNFLWTSGSRISCLCVSLHLTGHGLNDLRTNPGVTGLRLLPLAFLIQMTARQVPSHQALSQNLFFALMFPALPFQSPFFVLFVKTTLLSGPALHLMSSSLPSKSSSDLRWSLQNITATQSSNKPHLFTANPNAAKIKVYPKIAKHDLNLDPRTFIWADLVCL